MKKRKFLSIVLSLALVFSMTSAFTVATYADGEETDDVSVTADGEYIPYSVDIVKVNGVELSDGDFIENNGTAKGTGTHPSSGYAYYKNGYLYLNNFKLEGVKDHPAIQAYYEDAAENEQQYTSTTSNSSNTTPNALNIILQGASSITMNDVSGDDTKEYSAIDAGDLYLTISEGTAGASLYLQSNDGTYDDVENINDVDCVKARSFELKSGKVTIKAGTNYTTNNGGWNDTAICTYDGDVKINGGELNITSAAIAIAADWSFIMNGGTVNIGVGSEDKISVDGIISYSSVVINSGNLNISNVNYENSNTYEYYEYNGYAVKVNESFSVSGGNVTIKGCDYGISSSRGDIIIDGHSTVEINEITHNAMYSYRNISINNANVKIDTAGTEYYYETGNHYGCPAIYATNNVNLSNSNISIDNIGKDFPAVRDETTTYYNNGIGVCANASDSEIVINNCTIKINNTSSNALCSYGTLSIKDSNLSIDKAGENNNYNGIVVGGDFTIDNSNINIDNVGWNCMSGRQIDITNSSLKLTSTLACAVYTSTKTTVENSDVWTLSESDGKGYNAFYPSVTIKGNPVVCAGSTENDATRVTDFTKLNNYQFVHIYKDGVTPQTGFAGIITKLFSWLKTFNTGNSFTNSPVWKIFSAIFKLS